jgi:polyphenol oxidase
MAKGVKENSAIRHIDDLLGDAGLAHRPRSGAPRSRLPEVEKTSSAGKNPADSGKKRVSDRIEIDRSPLLKRLRWLSHGFSTRLGGNTTVYRPDGSGELNLGFNSADSDRNVLANRQLFLAAATGRIRPPSLITLRQIHSTLTRRVGREHATDRALLAGDAIMTNEPGVILGIQTADCIPILIADRRRKAVAAFHAGWRGTLRRIVENGVGRMRMEFGSEPADLVAAIGPGIGQCCYSVGEEVVHEFRSQFRYSEELFCEISDSDPVKEKYPMLFLSARAPGHSAMGPSVHLDLIEANRRQLLEAGLGASSISVVGECTRCHTDRYFSHRGEHGFAGRMLSVIAIRAGTAKS